MNRPIIAIMHYAVIMAGGSGTRLWPMSTEQTPKQLIPFIRGRSLLQIAVDRLHGLVPPDRQFICTSEALRGPIRSSMPDISDEQILGEPQGRDTLAAVGLPAAVLAQRDPQAIIAIFTADHLIEPVDGFQQRMDVGYELAERNPHTLVTFGIEPTHAATAYGYVRLGEPLDGFEGAYVTAEFKEKPDETAAQHYVESGEYRWNSGMFIWRASTLLECIKRYEPDVHAGLMEIADHWDGPRRRDVLDRVYPAVKKISVDYAVLERAAQDHRVKLATVSMPVKWLDVGSWPAFGQTLDADDQGNRLAAKALTMDSGQNIIVSDDPGHLIATIGVGDLIVVHTAKATLICQRDEAEKIKQLHQRIGETFGDTYL